MKSFGQRKGLTIAVATGVLALISGCSATTDAALSVEDAGSAAPASCAISQAALATTPQEAKLQFAGGVNKTTSVTGLQGSNSSVVQSFATSVAQNAGKTIGNDLAGWAMNALGIGKPNVSQELAKIQAQLAEISQQLQQIQAQLANITTEIQDSTYLDQIGGLTRGPIATISSLQQRYCQFIATAESNQSELTNWANSVVDASSGVQAQLAAIVEAFNGNAVTQLPPLVAMYSTFALNQKQIPEWGDVSGYQDVVEPYTQYFVNLVVLGMNLQAEAQHYLYPSDPAQAVQDVSDTWTSIRSMYQSAGFPASQPDGGSPNTLVVNNNSGEIWMQSPLCLGAKCAWNVPGVNGFDPPPWPNGTGFLTDMRNTPAPPGQSVSEPQFPNPMNPSWNGWQIPTMNQVKALWGAAPKGTSPWQFLKSIGFAVDKIGTETNSQLFSGAVTDFNLRQYECEIGQLCPYNDSVYMPEQIFSLSNGNSVSPTNAGLFAVSGAPTSWQGKGNYKGMPKRPDTAWLDALWPVTAPTS